MLQRDRAVLLADCVSETALARSGLLSGFAETMGSATLPEGTTLDDMKLWDAACNVSGDLSAEELVTVFKVRYPELLLLHHRAYSAYFSSYVKAISLGESQNGGGLVYVAFAFW